MDCQTALEFLDCVRPNSDDLDLPEMADARAHLDMCDTCQEAFANNQSFDRAVIDVVQDVDVPEGLRLSLPGANKTGANNSRRRTVLRAFSAACVLMLGVTAWLYQSQPVQFTEDKLLQQLPIDLRATEHFDAGFELALPAPWAGNPRLSVGREFRGIDLDGKAGHDAAVAIFRYTPSRNAPINGILVAIPASRVEPRPEALSFAQADVRYIPNRRPVAVVWKERDMVYVCLVLGSAADLEQIQRNLSTAAA